MPLSFGIERVVIHFILTLNPSRTQYKLGSNENSNGVGNLLDIILNTLSVVNIINVILNTMHPGRREPAHVRVPADGQRIDNRCAQMQWDEMEVDKLDLGECTCD